MKKLITFLFQSLFIILLTSNPAFSQKSCDNLFKEANAAKIKHQSQGSSFAYQAYLAAQNKFQRCLDEGGVITTPDVTNTPDGSSNDRYDGSQDVDPCLRGYEECMFVWEGNDECLIKCQERYNACNQEYEKFKVLNEKYEKCLESVSRCDVPESLVLSGMTGEEYSGKCSENYKTGKKSCNGDSECIKRSRKQFEECKKKYDDHIEFKKSCDEDYDSFCAGNPKGLRSRIIAANNKYIPLSTGNMQCAEVAATDSDGDGVPDNKDECPSTQFGSSVDVKGCSMEMYLSVSTDKKIYSPGDAIIVSGLVRDANRKEPISNADVFIDINPKVITKTNSSGEYKKELTLPLDISQGKHTVKVSASKTGYPDVSKIKNFTIGKLLLIVSSDKAKYITGDKVILKGKLSYGGKALYEAVYRTPIGIKIHRADGKIDEKFALTKSDGSFVVEYEVPVIPFMNIPPSLKKWNIEIFATPIEEEYGQSSTTLTIDVLPIYLKLHSVHLVQVVESPIINNYTYLAAGREAGLRVMVSCPNLKDVKDVPSPEVTVKMSIGWGATDLKEEMKTVAIGPDPTAIDFIFKLQPGLYSIEALIDPHYKYMDPMYSDQLNMSVDHPVKVKKMKTQRIEFVPTHLKLVGDEATLDFVKFCRKQANFIKSTFPIPNTNFKFLRTSRTMYPMYPGPFLGTKRWMILKALSLRSYLTSDKVVGVLPDSTKWWGEGESGNTGWSFPPFSYFSRSVLVKYGAEKSVTAHEIGHTLGLNRNPWNEEYKLHPHFGKKVNGLILKNGKLYNITKDNEKSAAFGKLTGTVYCFMGNNPGWPLPSWVCDETYPELFKYLMDPPGDIVYVSGTIYKNGTVQLDNWYLMEGEPDLVDKGDYTIQCISSNREVLYSTNFGKEPEEFLPFGFVIPYPKGTTTVLIKKGDEILKEVQKTFNSPTVKIQYPNGGEVVNGNIEVRWSGEDSDNNELYYSLLYSHDNGETWIAVVTEQNETNYTIDLNDFPGGDSCLVKVVATDGFNTGYDESDAVFTVDDKSPSARIFTPNNGEVFQVEEEILFQGIAYDLENEAYSGLSIEWSSSLDGVLGNKNELQISSLSKGNHEIIFTVTDMGGHKVEKRANIMVLGGGNHKNTPPIASFSIMPKNPQPEDTIVGASTSYDPDGDSLSYSWKINDVSRFGNTPFWEWDGPDIGEHTIKLAVEDGRGEYDEHSTVIRVGNESSQQELLPENSNDSPLNHPPVAEFTFIPPDPYSDEDMVFTSTSTDPDGDSLQYTWYIEDDHVKDLDNRSYWTYSLSESGSTPIRLVVKDGRGGVAEVTHTIHVREGTGESAVETAIEAPSQLPVLSTQMPEEPDEKDWSQVPVIGFTFMPEEPDEGDPIVLVNMCTYPSGEEVTYSWYVDGKHVPERDNQRSWELVGLPEGSHEIELEYREANGGGGSIIHWIEVY